MRGLKSNLKFFEEVTLGVVLGVFSVSLFVGVAIAEDSMPTDTVSGVQIESSKVKKKNSLKGLKSVSPKTDKSGKSGDYIIVEKPLVKKKELVILGWVERVRIFPEGLYIDAKLTPGSEGNVLHAESIELSKRRKKTYVRFLTVDRKGESQQLERELVNVTRYRTTKGAVRKRYDVKIPFCLNETYLELPFSLDDRSKFDQKMRIGRDALASHFLIDPAQTKKTKPSCIIEQEG